MLRAQGAATPASEGEGEGSKIKRDPGEVKRGQTLPGMQTAPQAEGPLAGRSGPVLQSGESDPQTALADRLAVEAEGPMGEMIGKIEAMLASAESLEEFRAMVLAAYPALDAGPLARVIGDARVVAQAGGILAVVTEGD